MAADVHAICVANHRRGIEEGGERIIRASDPRPAAAHLSDSGCGGIESVRASIDGEARHEERECGCED